MKYTSGLWSYKTPIIGSLLSTLALGGCGNNKTFEYDTKIVECKNGTCIITYLTDIDRNGEPDQAIKFEEVTMPNGDKKMNLISLEIADFVDKTAKPSIRLDIEEESKFKKVFPLQSHSELKKYQSAFEKAMKQKPPRDKRDEWVRYKYGRKGK